jgi:urease accessory protein
MRGFTTATGECLAHLNNVSGGVLGGDRLELEIEVNKRAQAQITTTGATRIYAPRIGSDDSLCSASIHLHEGGLLEYLPDPVIPFRGSRAEQRTRIHMQDGATLFWWEILAPGRVGHGECFHYECLRVASEIWTGATPILIDRMRLEPGGRPVKSPARFGGGYFLTTFVIAQVGARQSLWREVESELAGQIETDGVVWGISALPAHGILIRGLSDSGLSIAPGLYTFWKAAKMLLCGRSVTLPRKTY